MFPMGTLDLADRLRTCPQVDPAEADELRLPAVDVLHVLHEVGSDGFTDLLPPALHPSIPPAVSWLFIHSAQSPVGEFTLAQTRIICRLGLKPRALLSGAYVDNPDAAELLNRWGFGATVATVKLKAAYDRVQATVDTPDGNRLLGLELLDPTVFDGPAFIHPGLHLVQVPDGPRLCEVAPKIEFRRIDRGMPRVLSFDPAVWGEPRLRLTDPVAGVLAAGELILTKPETSLDPLVQIRGWE
jgi:hypothetical protein